MLHANLPYTSRLFLYFTLNKRFADLDVTIKNTGATQNNKSRRLSPFYPVNVPDQLSRLAHAHFGLFYTFSFTAFPQESGVEQCSRRSTLLYRSCSVSAEALVWIHGELVSDKTFCWTALCIMLAQHLTPYG